MSDKNDPTPAAGGPVEDLGSDFEVLEDPAAEPAAPPPAGSEPAAAPPAGSEPAAASARSAAAPPPAPAAGAAVPRAQAPPPTSRESWESLGLGLALAGLLGPWHAEGVNLVHGLLLACTLWWLLRHGLAAVHPSRTPLNRVLPALLLLWGGLRLAFAMGGNHSLFETFGWIGDAVEGQPGSNLVGAAFGAVLAFLGAALALAAPALGRKKDAAAPAAAAPAEVDQQFSWSLLAYTLMSVGLLLPWSSSGERGADSIAGALTLVLALLVLWASWASLWKLWTAPVVSRGLFPLLLFLAPLEALILGIAGLARAGTAPEEGILLEAWPRGSVVDPATGESVARAEPFLVYGGGAVLVLAGSILALVLLARGAKEAQQMIQQRKAEELARRKAAREARKKKGSGS